LNVHTHIAVNYSYQRPVIFHVMDVVSGVAIGAALVGVTLVCQCAGMGLLIHRVRGFYFGRSIHRLGPVRIAILVMRFTSLIIVLHLLQILLWAGFYRSKCI